MAAWHGGKLTDVPLSEVAGGCRKVSPDDPFVAVARAVGTSFGE
jgi:hypothetical protein